MLPSILVKGGHYTREQIVGHEVVESAGGRVVSIPIVPGYSTTAIIAAARKAVGSERLR
jgi:D-beta-D-heptose 7-phosphate kinase/D-beta-D-heptose 1-phosphate adenosyltransferase